MSRNFKKISVASAFVAATTLPTTMVSALETNVKNDSNTPVTLSSMKSMDTNIIMMIMVNYLKGFKKLMGIRIIFIAMMVIWHILLGMMKIQLQIMG